MTEVITPSESSKPATRFIYIVLAVTAIKALIVACAASMKLGRDIPGLIGVISLVQALLAIVAGILVLRERAETWKRTVLRLVFLSGIAFGAVGIAYAISHPLQGHLIGEPMYATLQFSFFDGFPGWIGTTGLLTFVLLDCFRPSWPRTRAEGVYIVLGLIVIALVYQLTHFRDVELVIWRSPRFPG